jgi:hypothetical protein
VFTGDDFSKAITAEQFWATFASELHRALEQDPDWPDKWGTDQTWTPFIKNVLTEVGYSLGFHEKHAISYEFYRLDVGYFSKGTFPDNGKSRDWDAWNLEVAIEHENNSESWHEEWIKLVHFNCGLKVLVTYTDYIPNAEPIETKLQRVKQIYDQAKYRQRPDNWCLIFGPTWKSGQHAFIAYEFDGTSFRRLPDRNIWPRFRASA